MGTIITQPPLSGKDSKGKPSFTPLIIAIIFIFIFFGVIFIIYGMNGWNLFGNINSTNAPKNTNQPSPLQPYRKTSYSIPKTIKKFQSYDELTEFLSGKISEKSGLYSGYSGGFMDEISSQGPSRSINDGFSYSSSMGFGTQELSPFSSRQLMNATDGSYKSMDYSPTNIQVSGVDEADIIKTDGKYIYAISNNSLNIIEAYPAKDASIESTVSFASPPQDMFVSGNYVAIFGNDNQIYSQDVSKKFKRRGSYSFVKIYDVSDKKNPKLVRDLDFEGRILSSRMIQGRVYLITTSDAYYIQDEPPIPRILDGGKEILINPRCKMCYHPDVYYFDPDDVSYNFTQISVIPMKDTTEPPVSEIYLLTGGQNLYVSENNIYITYTKHVREEDLVIDIAKEFVVPRLSVPDQERVLKIENADAVILTPSEKRAKIAAILQQYYYSLRQEDQNRLTDELREKVKERYQDISKELEKTIIHKIAISGSRLEYQNFGEVPGYVLNQFSMDEDNGYFRIATTKSGSWSDIQYENKESYNNLYVLNKDLKVVGRLEELGETERIYSVRFMQGRAYMITFRETDPLFVIDVSDPKNPEVLGKLKIPGFSNYLHPYDNTTLIGVGQERGTSRGLKLSLYDVSDVENPKEIDKYVFEDLYSSSLAQTDHKAFLFSKEKNLLVLPVSMQVRETTKVKCPPSPPCSPLEPCPLFESNCIQPQYKYFKGAAVFHITKDGFELKGKIEHSSYPEYESGYAYRTSTYEAQVKRSLYIEDVLYTLSDKMMKLNQLKTLNEIKEIDLP